MARAAAAAAAVVAALLTVLLARGAALAQEKPVTFADVAGVPALPAEDASRLARYAGERLHESKAITPLPPTLKADVQPRVVFVSASDGEQTAHVAMAAERGAVAAADAAIARVVKLLPDVTQRLWIKVDVVNHVEPLPPGATTLGLGVTPSLQGLELAGGVAFLPEELLGWHIVEGGRLIEDSVYDYLDARPARAKLPADGDLRGARRFTCTSYFIQDDNTPIPLYRGHRPFQVATPDDLRIAADAAGAYLVRSVTATGQFDYSYRIDRNEVPNDYNIVRHAGTIWAMLELYRDTEDEELLAAVERAMRYLLAQIQPCRIGNEQVVGVVGGDEVSLGGNALAALSLATYIEITGKRDQLPILRALGRAMRAAQAPGGRFTVQRQRFSTGDVFFDDGPYAPGEAVLALVKLHDVDPDDAAALEAAARAAKFLITVRDAEKPIEELPHDHWLLYSLRYLHAKRPDELYPAHAIRLCRSIIEQQQLAAGPKVPPDGVGAWAEARSTPAATRAEGLLAAAALMRAERKLAEAEDFFAAGRRSIAFQLRTQVWPESAMHCRNPRRALGGFREDLGGVYVRIDFVQHNLSAILELTRQMREPVKTQAP